jgi:hypothetical protein
MGGVGKKQTPIGSILSSPAGLREPQLELAKIVGSEADVVGRLWAVFVDGVHGGSHL